MSGGLIATMVAPHTPRMGVEDRAPDFVRGLIAGLKEMGGAVRALQPDLFVLHSAHWVSTFNWYVTAHAVHEGVCVADEAPELIPGTPYRREGDPGFAEAMAGAMNDAGIPCGLNESPHYAWDYATLVPLQYLDPEASVPVATLTSVLCADSDECFKVGGLAHDAAVASGKRAAFISSCALSHKILRGPELWPPDELQAMDRRFVELACAGRTAELIAWFPTFAEEAVAEMGGRTLSSMLGAMDALEKAAGELEGRQFGAYAQSSGSGNASLCVTPKSGWPGG
jgi:3,4-dihydroxyphenylacetate 2,3-dioxygenase